MFGIIDGKPHLRIENRVWPVRPSAPDEFANAAFWCGTMVEFSRRSEDITEHINFDHAAGNFYTEPQHVDATTANGAFARSRVGVAVASGLAFTRPRRPCVRAE